MRATYVKITGYIPLLNNGIQDFEWKPQDGITGILGSNGSGKTAIMRVTSPLSGERAMFDDTGSVYIEYLHTDGTKYGVGYEVVNNKLIHHFFRGNELEELNRGGTGKEQDSLAEQIFGYTKTIHQCLTGKIKFSLASPSKRAALLQDVVAIDVTEGEKVYDSLRSEYRDLQGVHSHISLKIVQAQDLILDEANIQDNKELADSCLAGIDYLRSKGIPKPDTNWEELNYRFDTQCQRLMEVAQSVEKAKHLPDVLPVGEESTYPTKLSLQIANLESNLVTMTGEYFELEKSLGDSDINHGKLREDATLLISELNKELEVLTQTGIHFFDDVEESEYPTVTLVMSNFFDFVQSTLGLKSRDNLNPEVCKLSSLNTLETELANLQNELTTYNNRISSGEAWLVRVNATDKEECPKCKHQYWKDYDPKDVDRITAALETYSTYPPRLKAKIADLEPKVLEIKDFRRSMELILTEVYKLPDCLTTLVLRVFLDNTGEFVNSVFDYHVLTSNLKGIHNRVAVCTKVIALRDKREYNQDLLTKLDELAAGNIYEKLSKRAYELNTNIDKDTRLIALTRQAYTEALAAVELRDFYVKSGITIDLIMEDLLVITEAMFAVCDYDCNEASYRALQLRLATATELISYNESNRLALDEYTKDLADTTAQLGKLELLIKALSPQTGLIAKEMTNGINQFTTMMNATLADMWTYSMIFEPCDLEKGKLSYRFPVTIKSGRPIADIVEGSDGQRQVVDFVFTILYVAQKGLKDFPLILDEPATGLDHQHASIFFGYVRRLANEKFCNQIFLISHLFGVMGDFAEVDLVVLDEENVHGLSGQTYNNNVYIG